MCMAAETFNQKNRFANRYDMEKLTCDSFSLYIHLWQVMIMIKPIGMLNTTL